MDKYRLVEANEDEICSMFSIVKYLYLPTDTPENMLKGM